MQSPLTFIARVPANLPECKTYKACIGGYVVELDVDEKRWICEVSRGAYSSPLDVLLRTHLLRDSARIEFEVDVNTITSIRRWVSEKIGSKVDNAVRRPAEKLGEVKRGRGRPPRDRAEPRSRLQAAAA